MSDRHPKWVRVKPGTVIPAGQPYRYEYETEREWRATVIKNGEDEPFHVLSEQPHFVDSSWKPHAVLPTEPTWGIAVVNGRNELGLWERTTTGSIMFADRSYVWGPRNLDKILDFIPLTDEQVARIEAAR